MHMRRHSWQRISVDCLLLVSSVKVEAMKEDDRLT
jgi:hypothetical protein